MSLGLGLGFGGGVLGIWDLGFERWKRGGEGGMGRDGKFQVTQRGERKEGIR